MTPEAAIKALARHAVDGKAAEMKAYHNAPRTYLGLANPMIDSEVKAWRAQLSVPERVALADGLWQSNIHEARIAATKLLTQARLRPDAEAWRLGAGF